MTKLGFKKIKWLAVATVLIAIFLMWYLPFVNMEDFVTGRRKYYYISNGLPPDKTEELISYLRVYPLCCFLHKGDTYSDIPFIDSSFHKHKMDIKFNWDNSVTICEGTKKLNLNVNRIWIEPQLYPVSDKDYIWKLHENRDSLYVGIFMYDDKNNEIDVYRQKSTMPLGGRRVGFRIDINGKVFVTGAKEIFHY